MLLPQIQLFQDVILFQSLTQGDGSLFAKAIECQIHCSEENVCLNKKQIWNQFKIYQCKNKIEVINQDLDLKWKSSRICPDVISLPDLNQSERRAH